MRLRLKLSADWKIIDHQGQRMAMIPGAQPSRPAVVVVWGPLFPAAASDAALLAQALGSELGTGRLDVDPEEAKQTADGWRYVEQTARVLAGGTLAEERLAAVFQLAEWRAAVIVRSFDPVRWLALSPSVRAAFAGATPDWRGDGEILCLADLYDPPGE